MDWHVLLIIAAVVVWILIQFWLTACHSRWRQYLWKKRLHRKGYDWLTFHKTGRLMFELEGYLHDIPMEEDIAGHENYRKGDVDALIGILKNDSSFKSEENERYEQYGITLAIVFIVGMVNGVASIVTVAARGDFGLGMRVFWILIAFEVVVAAWVIIRAISVKEALRSKGYRWINISDSVFILLRLGKNVRRIPARDEMATVPGYVDGNAARLVMAVKKHMPENRG